MACPPRQIAIVDEEGHILYYQQVADYCGKYPNCCDPQTIGTSGSSGDYKRKRVPEVINRKGTDGGIKQGIPHFTPNDDPEKRWENLSAEDAAKIREKYRASAMKLKTDEPAQCLALANFYGEQGLLMHKIAALHEGLVAGGENPDPQIQQNFAEALKQAGFPYRAKAGAKKP